MSDTCQKCAYTLMDRNGHPDGCVSCEYAPEDLDKCLRCPYQDSGCPGICPRTESELLELV